MAEPIAIETKADHERAMIRIAELAGSLDGSPEEEELIKLQLAVEIWETKPKPIRWPTD
jgi:hypothetical protein